MIETKSGSKAIIVEIEVLQNLVQKNGEGKAL